MSAQLVKKFKRADPSQAELTINRASQRVTSISSISSSIIFISWISIVHLDFSIYSMDKYRKFGFLCSCCNQLAHDLCTKFSLMYKLPVTRASPRAMQRRRPPGAGLISNRTVGLMLNYCLVLTV
jgi:hypothetical protein